MTSPGAPARRARASWCLSPLATLLVAAACSSGPSAAATVRDAAAATVAAGTARVSVALTVDTEQGLFNFTGAGVMDLGSDQGRLAMDLHAFGLDTVDLSLDGRTVYLRWPGLAGAYAWLRIDLGGLGVAGNVDLAALSQIGHANPAWALDLLGSAGGARRVGGERLRGVATTRYHTVVPLDAVPLLADLPGVLGVAEVAAGVWIDGDGRIRKMTVSVDPQGQGGLPGLAVTFETYDFGTPLDVAFPPPAEVSDLTELVRSRAARAS